MLRAVGIAAINHEDLVILGELLETGKIVPIIDRSYPLNDAADAIRILIYEHAQGTVVITVAHEGG